MKFNSNIILLIVAQIAILLVFNIVNRVEWWMNLLLAAPIILVAVHFLMKKVLGKGLFFLETTRNAQMNYVNNFKSNNARNNNFENNAMNASNARNNNIGNNATNASNVSNNLQMNGGMNGM